MPPYRTVAGVLVGATVAGLLGIFALSAVQRAGDGPGATPSPEAARAARERALEARTLALEQLADRCVPDLFGEAETEREAADRAMRQDDLEPSRVRYQSARALYDRATARAAVTLVRGTCMRDIGPTLALPGDGAVGVPNELPYDPPGERPDVAEPGDPLPRPDPSRPTLPTRPPPTRQPMASDASELDLRTRATELVEAGRSCDAIALLQREGTSRRTRALASALGPACRSERRR